MAAAPLFARQSLDVFAFGFPKLGRSAIGREARLMHHSQELTL